MEVDKTKITNLDAGEILNTTEKHKFAAAAAKYV
jgi:hypothetical protein